MLKKIAKQWITHGSVQTSVHVHIYIHDVLPTTPKNFANIVATLNATETHISLPLKYTKFSPLPEKFDYRSLLFSP